MRKNWLGPDLIDSSDVVRLVDELRISPAVARVLVSRGKADVDVARRFLEPSLDDLASPFGLLGADVAVDRILRSLRERERIVVFGDFDVDGVTSTSLAILTLRGLGADVVPFLPKRLVHGYGLSHKAIPDLLALKPGLVITVDCGIRSVEEVAELTRQGVDTIITDHHEPGPELPPAVAVVDPKQAGCRYEDKRLAGVGVTFQILRGLVSRLESEVDLFSHLDLVALGTVADVVPLDGENRIIVSHGLRVMNRREKPGIMSLLTECGVDGPVEAWHLAYLVGPRINAAGRLGDAGQAVELLTTDDTARANQLARLLEQENLRRQELSKTTLDQALEAIESGVAGESPDGIVLASNTWHPGVIGIASAKIVERYHRPTALIAMDGEVGRGSVRSIRGVDVCQVLDECADLLVQYGGHAMAAGLTVPRDRIEDLRRRFSEAVSQRLTKDNSVPCLHIDSELTPTDVSLELAEDLEKLGPFGFGNPRPIVLLNGVQSVGRKVVGRRQDRGGHLKMSLVRPNGPALDVIGFDLGDRSESDFPAGFLDVVGNVAVNEWNGRRTAQLQLLDYRGTVS